MVACRYEISLLEFNSASHSLAALTRELLSQTIEEKIRIPAWQGYEYPLFISSNALHSFYRDSLNARSFSCKYGKRVRTYQVQYIFSTSLMQ